MDLVGRTSSSRGDPAIIRLGVSRPNIVLTSDRIIPATARYSCLGEHLSGLYQREQSKSSSFEINMVTPYMPCLRVSSYSKNALLEGMIRKGHIWKRLAFVQRSSILEVIDFIHQAQHVNPNFFETSL